MRISGFFLLKEQPLCSTECIDIKCIKAGEDALKSSLYYSGHSTKEICVYISTPVPCFTKFQFIPKVYSDSASMINPTTTACSKDDQANGRYAINFSWSENLSTEDAKAVIGIDIKDVATGTLLTSFEKDIKFRGCRHTIFDEPAETHGIFHLIVLFDLSDTAKTSKSLSIFTDSLSVTYGDGINYCRDRRKY